MSRAESVDGKGRPAVRSLRDDLASLRIERNGRSRSAQPGWESGGRNRRGGGWLMSLLLWIIPLGLIGGAGAYLYPRLDAFRPKPEVSIGLVQELTPGEAEKLFTAKGYLKSRHQAMIGAKVPGRVETMLVEEGSKVQAGDLLAVLEHNDLDALLESRRATLQRTEAELKESQAELRDLERKARRWALLRLRNQASVEEAEQAAFDSARGSARVEALVAAVKLSEAAIRETEETIRNMRIVAPFAGTVVAKEAEVGETITPGGMGASSGRGSVATLADLNLLEVEIDVAETLLSRVEIGQPAEISVSAVPNKHYRGRVRQVIPMSDRSTRNVKVKVEVLDPDDRLFPELAADVHLLPRQSIAAEASNRTLLFMPKAAVVEEGGQTYAWVVVNRSKVQRRPIQVVLSADDLARVEDGLSPGESVVLNPARTLKDGQPIEVVE